MKKIYTYFASALALLSMGSCKSWLDINTDPNYVADAKIKSLLPTTQLITAYKVGYDINLYGYFWAQYVNQCSTANQYYTNMTYDVTNSSFTSPWSYFYGSVMPTLKEIITKGEAEEGNTNYVMEAKTMLAYNLYLLTSLYDKVAYSEGYLTESQNPHFDSGEDMQKHIIGILEEVRGLHAKAKTDESNNLSASSDMVFGGNIDGWLQFANTLYLKMMLRDFNTNKSKIEALLSEDNLLKQDAAFDNFLDASDKSNPLYENDRRKLNSNMNIRACSDIANVLDASDPRFAYYYDSNPDGKFRGEQYGLPSDPTKTSRLALELRLCNLDGNDGGKTLAEVLLRKFNLHLLQHLVLVRIVSERTRQSHLESLEMGTALYSVDIVHIREDSLLITRIVLESDIDRDNLV